MWKTSLFLFSFFIVANIAKDGECPSRKRVTEIINSYSYSYSAPVSIQRWVQITECCSGYRNISGECKPVCEPECFGTGRCVAPNKCECDGHWTGNICDEILRDCEDGYWGKHCNVNCDCNGSKCSPSYGECICRSGYTGLKCEISCSNGTFGENCSQTCNCFGDCHHVTGNCICEPGYTGINCSTTCPEEKYGANCSQICICQNGSKCDKINGKCTCKPGYQGELCEKTCPLGTWGIGCSKKCTCGNTPCDTSTGRCYCKPGYFGIQCKDPCQEGTCGDQCTQTCNCSNGKCSNIDCTCTCNEGWTGVNCNQTICDFMKHGNDCTKMCACNETNTEKCDFLTGTCICKPGWIGDACTDRYCPTKFYDKETEECIDTPAFYIIISIHNIITIGISAVTIILVVTITVVVYVKCKKPRYDGMININAPKIHLRPPSISTQNQYQRPEPMYEIIPDVLPPPEYQRLFRSDEVTDRIQDPTYFDGYERPIHVGNIEMQVTPDYISLDTNSIPPQWPSNTNHYYQFRP